MFEFFFLGLRKTTGVNLGDFERMFGCRIEDAYPGITEVLIGSEFLKRAGEMLSLTKKGLFVADSVIENFIFEGRTIPQTCGTNETCTSTSAASQADAAQPLAANS